ncbi:MAG: hypothetical protein IJE09_06425 [Oscillospiraceae bacterium]|nr:hypothetical protein [Oscillospiraceae bacterium]
MKTENLFDAMDLISQDYKKEAIEAMKNKNETRRRAVRTPIRIVLIAAIIASLFVGTAFAVGNYINSPAQAEKVAQAELKKMQDLGILSEKFSVEGIVAERVIELPVFEGEDYFFGRIWPHRYSVQWYMGSPEGNPYTVITQVDTAEGRIMAVTIEAAAGEDAVAYRVLEDQEVPVGYDEEKQQPIVEIRDLEYFDNYEDIIPEGITVDEMCTRLNEYWGFGGYTVVDTVDEFYGFEDVETPGGDSLVRDLPQDNYYLSVVFEGDQQGVPRYIQTVEFPGRVCMIIGTNHAVG